METLLEFGPSTEDLNLCDRCHSYDENLSPTSYGWICRGCTAFLLGDGGFLEEELTSYSDVLV